MLDSIDDILAGPSHQSTSNSHFQPIVNHNHLTPSHNYEDLEYPRSVSSYSDSSSVLTTPIFIHNTVINTDNTFQEVQLVEQAPNI